MYERYGYLYYDIYDIGVKRYSTFALIRSSAYHKTVYVFMLLCIALAIIIAF